MKRVIISISTVLILLIFTELFVLKIEKNEYSQTTYRMPLPNKVTPYFAPGYIRYISKNANKDSVLFFGDSTVWGINPGREKSLPHITSTSIHQKVYNLAMLGAAHNDIFKLVDYASEKTSVRTLVMPIQYFWNYSSSSYGQLDEILKKGRIPWALYQDNYLVGRKLFGMQPKEKIQEMYDYYRFGISIDSSFKDEFKRNLEPKSFADWDQQKQQEITDYDKPLFIERTIDDNLKNSLLPLTTIAKKHPDKTFYVYVPPYLYSEIQKHSKLPRDKFDSFITSILSIYDGVENIKVKNFNEYEWDETHFSDWVHLSYKGNQRLGRMIGSWLTEGTK